MSAVTSVPTAAAKAARSAETVVPQGTSTNKWQFQFSPYFWLASLHGTGGIGNRTTQVDESFSDIFHSLDLALMGVLEARKGKFVTLTDVEYVAVSDNKATPGPFFSNVNAAHHGVGFQVLTWFADRLIGRRGHGYTERSHHT